MREPETVHANLLAQELRQMARLLNPDPVTGAPLLENRAAAVMERQRDTLTMLHGMITHGMITFAVPESRAELIRRLAALGYVDPDEEHERTSYDDDND